jgi:hypothetical protein
MSCSNSNDSADGNTVGQGKLVTLDAKHTKLVLSAIEEKLKSESNHFPQQLLQDNLLIV